MHMFESTFRMPFPGGSVYNVEVYRALNTRGGAIWARFEDERRSEERNQQGVDQLGAREEPKAEKA